MKSITENKQYIIASARNSFLAAIEDIILCVLVEANFSWYQRKEMVDGEKPECYLYASTNGITKRKITLAKKEKKNSQIAVIAYN